MREPHTDKPNLIFRLLIGCVGAAWLYAFMPPMEHLGLLQGASTILPVLLVLVIGQLFPWMIVRLILALIVVIGYTLNEWIHAPTLSLSLRLMFREEWHQAVLWFHTMKLGDPLQTTLFLIVLCLVYWLVVYAALRPKLWTFYNFLAVLVLGIVDGNTGVHPNQSIVVQLILFVCLLGIMQFRRLSGQLVYRGRPLARFFVPLAALLVVAAGIGFVVPKPGPVWADPFSRFDTGTNGIGGGRVIKTIGYQMDNARLGGSFVPNHDPVLAVVSSEPAYLKGEVYSQYTGHGWLAGPANLAPVSVGQQLPASSLQFQPSSGVPTKALTQEISVLTNHLQVPILFSAYSPEKLVADVAPKKGSGVSIDTNTGVLSTPPLQNGQVYTVKSLEMQPPDAKLSSLPALPSNHQTAFPADVKQQYLQLPGNLPSDIRQLTNSLTKGMTSEYDIVVTVQNYLKLNYTYATTGIPVPAPAQDYVSQFLFDSKKGYCNNFSSSMAVMLRTIGIPTRWVTGFTSGTLDPNYTGNGDRFVVTNADAHSWVEVYFPQVGWVPFDPTPQFNMTFAFPDSTGSTAPATPPKSPVKPPTPPVTPPAGTTSASGTSFSIPWLAILRVLLWIIGVVVVLGGLLSWFFRHKLVDWYHRKAWSKDTPDGFQRGVLHLVRLLIRVGDVRQSTPTIRDLQPAARSYGVEEADFQEFVQTFESYAYGGTRPDESRLRKVRQTWTKWVLEVLRRGR